MIKDIMYCVSPILKEIKLYDGIKVGRNKLFAHYNRDKNFNFIPWWKSLYGVTLPRTIEELVFINAVIGTIRAIIISQYINDLEEFKKITNIDVDVYLKFVESEEINAKDKVSKLENIMNEVSKRITEKKIIIRKIM
ncbi:MAG: hypothetical protein IPM95_13800 [Sphingobacteriales bacterium]|nr:hypothetical protein [Sphingobacteriales bacterium]